MKIVLNEEDLKILIKTHITVEDMEIDDILIDASYSSLRDISIIFKKRKIKENPEATEL